MPKEKIDGKLCARCNRAINGRGTRYTLHDGEGFKFMIYLHRSCAIAFADVLMRDNTKQGFGFFSSEPKIRVTLDEIMGQEAI